MNRNRNIPLSERAGAVFGVPTEASRESGGDKLASGEAGCHGNLMVNNGMRMNGSPIARGDITVERPDDFRQVKL